MSDRVSGVPFRRVIWLLPAAFALHIVEEYVGGFPGWVTNVVGGSFDDLAFALNNAAFMAAMLALTAWASRTNSARATFLLILWSSANIFWDAGFHVAMTAYEDRYSPGLMTAAFLYLPLSYIVTTSCVSSRSLNVRSFALASLCGLVLFGFVVWYGLFHFAI